MRYLDNMQYASKKWRQHMVHRRMLQSSINASFSAGTKIVARPESSKHKLGLTGCPWLSAGTTNEGATKQTCQFKEKPRHILFRSFLLICVVSNSNISQLKLDNSHRNRDITMSGFFMLTNQLLTLLVSSFFLQNWRRKLGNLINIQTSFRMT